MARVRRGWAPCPMWWARRWCMGLRCRPPPADTTGAQSSRPATRTRPATRPKRFTFDPARWSASSRAAARRSAWRWTRSAWTRSAPSGGAAEAAAPGQRRGRPSVAGRSRKDPVGQPRCLLESRRMRPGRGRSTSAARASSDQQGCGAVHNKIALRFGSSGRWGANGWFKNLAGDASSGQCLSVTPPPPPPPPPPPFAARGRAGSGRCHSTCAAICPTITTRRCSCRRR